MSIPAEPLSARRAQTQDKLVEAATAAFAQRGVLAASIEEICEQAGFTRGAFYSNFSSKDELCLAWLRRYRDDMLSIARDAIATTQATESSDDPEQLIRAAASLFVETQENDPVTILAALEVRLFAARNVDLRGGYVELISETRQLCADVLNAALARFGWKWAVDPLMAVGILQAIYEQSTMDAMLSDRDIAPTMIPTFVSVLSTMITKP